MQNSRLKKEILGPHKEVSAKELELYNQGKLSGDRAREVEMKLHSNAFSAEAAEGFSTYGKGIPVSELSKKYASKNYNGYYFGALVLVLAIGTWFYWPASSGSNQPESFISSAEDEVSEEAINSELITETEKSHPSSEERGRKIESKSTANKTKSSLEILKESDEETVPLLFSTVIEKEIFKPQTLDRKTLDLTPDEEVPEAASQKIRLRHYRNYKFVDQGIGIDQSLLAPILDGTPAFSERVYVHPEYPEWMSADSVYQLTINKIIDYIIDEDFSAAQTKLKRLIENQPDDLTATFYMGYVLYLKANYEEAIAYFNKTETHIIQTFDHDARFLEIKCLLELGKDDEAKKEALFLKNSESFYAEKAMELVD